jgi:hypothetical protein
MGFIQKNVTVGHKFRSSIKIKVQAESLFQPLPLTNNEQSKSPSKSTNHNRCYYRKALWWITFSLMFMHTAHTDLGTCDPYPSWHKWCNMQNETAMGTEKCVMITLAYSITNTAFITGMILYEMVSE